MLLVYTFQEAVISSTSTQALFKLFTYDSEKTTDRLKHIY